MFVHMSWLFGLDVHDIGLGHMIARAILVYIVGITVILLNRRFIGEHTNFDTILRFIIGSSFASAIVGSSPFFPTLGAMLFLVFMNWILSAISFYSPVLEKLIKGQENILFTNGAIDWQVMQRHHLTQDDLLSEVRKKTGLTAFENIDRIFLENSGEISIIPKVPMRIAGDNEVEED